MKTKLAVLGFLCLMAMSCKNAPSMAARIEGQPRVEPQESSVMDMDAADDDGAETEALLMDEEPLPVTVDELFDDFIFNFASNSQLQLERIAFPLLVNSGTHKDTLLAKDWKMEQFFMNQGEYTLLFDSQEQMEQMKDTTLNDAIVEKIFLDEEFIRQYVFHRDEGKWMLHEIRNQTLPRNPNASFIAFYHHFVTDSVYQQASLSEEIVFVGPDPDDDFAQMEGIITPDSWEAFAPELPKRMLFNVVYGQRDSTSNEKIFVLRGISNGQELELTFHRDDDHWRLTKLME